MTITLKKIPDFIMLQRAEIQRLAAHYGISNVRVFGSYVRGEDQPDSDVDVLVHFEPALTGSGFSFLEFARELETLLNKKIDLVLDTGLSPYLGPVILDEAIPL